MAALWENLVLEDDADPAALSEAFDRMIAERKRVIAGILDGSISLELIDDDEGY